MRTRTLETLIVGLALTCVLVLPPRSFAAQGDIAKEIERLEQQILGFRYGVELCDASIQLIAVPAEDAPDEEWEKYKQKVDEAEKCVANLESAIGALKKRVAELLSRLPNIAVGEREDEAMARMRQKLLDQQKRIDQQPPIIKQLRARLDRLRARKKK